MYSDFACEAVLEEPECAPEHQLLDQPKKVLTRYFDDRLASLLVADRECEARTHGICNMDFSPVWDSQDWSGTYVVIRAASDSNHVDARLRLSRNTVRALRYTLVRTPAGWRIHDIGAPKKWSLVKSLSGKP